MDQKGRGRRKEEKEGWRSRTECAESRRGFGWFWGVATGVVVAYPCGLPLSAPRGQGGLPPTTVIRLHKGWDSSLCVCIHTYIRLCMCIHGIVHTFTDIHLRKYTRTRAISLFLSFRKLFMPFNNLDIHNKCVSFNYFIVWKFTMMFLLTTFLFSFILSTNILYFENVYSLMLELM